MRALPYVDARRDRVLVLREAPVLHTYRDARDVALRILSERYSGEGRASQANGLFGFQREAVERARAILLRHGGVLIADSVGLGKTHVALELAREAVERGERVAIVGPAALQGHWRRAARPIGDVDWMSYARLSRSGVGATRHDLVVLDEAHALRNPATRRYRAAVALCAGARVVLLTATPVNNSVWDLYHLLRLFAGDRDFLHAGVPSLRSAFADAEAAALLGAAPSLQPVLRAVMIRRTRPFVRDAMRDDRRAAALTFPAQESPRPVYYAFAGGPEALEHTSVDLLELEFPAHDGGAGSRTGAPGLATGLPPVELMRRGLLKRLESSVHAFRCSLDAYDSLLERCEAALDRGLLVRARDDAERGPDAGAQLRLDALLFRPIESPADALDYRAALERERARVTRLRASCGGADAKLEAVAALLLELRGRKVIVFTQFRDTARYLHARLRHRFRCALIDGAGALLGADTCDRMGVVRRFAPLANGAPPPGALETVDVLIATDVLSEGFNLQDASVVVSYDLPWNPIRLVQRVGRVDRLGSRHASVASYHFLPGDLERYLGLVERIARKTSAIEATVGSDMPMLHTDLVRALDRRDGALLDRIEREDADWFELDERMHALLRRLGPGALLGATSTPIGAPGHCDTATLIGALAPGTLGRGADAPSGIVAARVGARFEWVAIVDGSARSDERLCARAIERACAAPEVGATPTRRDVERLLELARIAIVRREAGPASVALLPAGGPAARTGRALLGMVAALPTGPDPALCARVEAALERLARAPDSAVAALPRPAGSAARALGAMLAAIDGLPARRPGLGEPAETAAERPVRILAALVETAPDR